MTTGFERYSKKTRWAAFLEEMEKVVPWSELCSLVEPHYPRAGNGRRPVGIERMLRIYSLQQWFNLSDPAVEEALLTGRVALDKVPTSLVRGSQPVSGATLWRPAPENQPPKQLKRGLDPEGPTIRPYSKDLLLLNRIDQGDRKQDRAAEHLSFSPLPATSPVDTNAICIIVVHD